MRQGVLLTNRQAVIENHACATRGHEVTNSFYACVRIPRGVIYEAEYFIAE